MCIYACVYIYIYNNNNNNNNNLLRAFPEARAGRHRVLELAQQPVRDLPFTICCC